MSTKTLRKRIALVAVSAMGFGLLSSAPSNGADDYTSSLTVSTTSLTVVASSASASLAGMFYVDSFGAAGTSAALETTESITVSVIAKPTRADGTDTELADITIGAVKRGTIGASFTSPGSAPVAGAFQIPNAATAATLASSALNTTSAAAAKSARYYFAVYGSDSDAIDAGEYTLRIRLLDANSFSTDYSIKVKFVSSAADSGAVITLAQTGTFNTGGAIVHTAAQKVTATLKDANGGRIQNGIALTGDINSSTPTILGQIVDVDGAIKDELTELDAGVDGEDMIASTSTTAAVVTDYALSQENNGVYGLTDASIAAAAAVDNAFRVRYGSTSTSLTMTSYATSTAIDGKTDLTLTATGVLAADQLIKSNVDTTTAYTLPTTATSAKLRINTDIAADTALADQPMTVKTVWSGNYASASVSPASATVTTTSTDASGNIDLTITNSAPLAGAVATVTITGYTYTAGSSRGTVAGSTIVTLTWAAAKATTITVIDPVASVKVKTGSTNVLTVSVKDQFGTLMSGQSLQPSVAGSNVSTTTTYAAITTGTDGTATFSLTDAKAVTATADTVSFASVSNSAATAGSFVLNYVATLPTVSTMTGYYNNDWNTAVASVNSLIPSTGIYALTGTATKTTIANTRDTSKSLAAHADGTEDDMVIVRFRAVDSTGAAAAGAAVTITAPTGGHIVGAAGTPVSTRTVAVGADGDVSFQILATAPGALTWTIASGTVSASVSVWVATPTEAAGRTVALTGGTTATANSAGVPMTVTVKDRYGNAVSGVTLTLSATGVAAFAGGATTQSFTTDSTGTYTFEAKSFTAAGGVGTYKVSAGNAADSASTAGYSGGAAVDSTLAAGVSSASATVTFGAGEDAAAANAQAATDAAAEATDAANAATDAANAAAEAADAATAAAQDAADAVAALSAQVASLISGLKAQLTALTNLVIKIQKKVKA